LQRTLRIDMLWKENGEPHATKVELEGNIPGPPVGALQVESMEVVVHPIAWYMCPVRFSHESEGDGTAGGSPDFSPVNAWFRKWIGETEPKTLGDDGLSGVVHSLSPPMRESGGGGGVWVLLVDLGSAPVEALAELLETIRQIGATDVKIGSALMWDVKRSTIAAMAGELESAGFAEKIAGIAREELGVKARPSGPMELEIQSEQGLSMRANLENLYRILGRLDAAGRTREIGHWLQTHRDQFARLSGETPPPSLEALRPVVKDQQFVDAVRKKIGEKTPKIWRPLAGDLWIVYVWDQPHGMQFLTNDDPDRHGLSAQTLHERAVANYLKARPLVEVDNAEGVLIARTHDNYDASLLLDDAFWRQMGGKIRGDVLVCVPTRDVVLISGTGEDGGLARLRLAAKKIMEGGDHLVSATVLRRHGGKWEVFAGHMAIAPPETLADAPPKKKPWWKFW
jgi:uncharacterized protein YtpQ (UPF0354 family)